MVQHSEVPSGDTDNLGILDEDGADLGGGGACGRLLARPRPSPSNSGVLDLDLVGVGRRLCSGAWTAEESRKTRRPASPGCPPPSPSASEPGRGDRESAARGPGEAEASGTAASSLSAVDCSGPARSCP